MSAPAAGQDRPQEGRAAELAAIARDLAGRGEAQQALALVQAELDPTVDPASRATLLFTLGWLEHQIADQDRARRMQHLEAAERRYTEGLELAPGQTSAMANLALVQGDIALERGEREAALASWRRALALAPDETAAAERFLALLGSDSEALAAEARRLEADGYPELARRAWVGVLAATPPEAQGEPALHWLLLTAEAGLFTRASVDELPVGGAALAELRLLAQSSEQAPVPSWAGSPLGRHAVAEGFRSRAAEELRGGNAEGALGLIERGLAVAPKPPVLGRREARLDLAQDALELLLARPALDPRGERFEAQKDLLLYGGADTASADLAARLSYHAAAGRLLAARAMWTDPEAENAAYHLRLAIELRREQDRAAGVIGASRHPLPELSMLLGAGLKGSGDPEGALEAYLDACEGFLAQNRRPEAEEALREAKAIAAQLGGSQRALEVEAALLGFQPPVIEEVVPVPVEPPPAEPSRSDGLFTRLFAFDGDAWSDPSRAGAFAPSSWYAGAGFGAAWLVTSEGSVEDDLDDVDVDLDDGTEAYRLYGGYRFSLPLAVELGYTDLGQIESVVGPFPPGPLDQFLEQVADEHPAPGSGPTLALRGLLYGNDWIALGVKVGLWYWEADVEVQAAGAEVKIDRDGTDLIYGLDLSVQPFDWASIRIDLEDYGHDDDDTFLATLGVELQLDRLFD